ncbi:hypothetical protein BP422_13840 [Brevibacillus formosus]|uniref:Uncharacterized protein n=1 Tax=Brevibacillus formosus TaxID=54913 RepID=A0A220MHZ7_9BACL|nr:hypothetical protein [Brevibacillus formosus]ASJ54545.1 hypothetical protein BP422_13840 [Brevibacillus formosus]
MKSSRGRPQAYTDQQLKEILLLFVSKNKGKVSYLALEKETGIKRHVWARRLGKEIQKLNEPKISIQSVGDHLPLPNVEELIEHYGQNKTGLIRALGHLNEVVQDFYYQVTQYRKDEEKYKQQLELLTEKDKEIDELKSQVQHYKQLYEQAFVQSAYPSLREENQIKSNLISLTKDKRKKLSTDFTNAFPELFDD